MYQLIKYAGMDNQELISEHSSYDEAAEEMNQYYCEEDIEEYHIDILKDWSTEY